MKKCLVGCQTDAVINTALQDIFLNINFVNSYMDFDDYDTPVKTYVDDRYSYRGVPGFGKKVTMYMKENSVELSDSILGLGQTTSQEFFRIDNTVHDLHPFRERDFFEVSFVLDPQKDTYSRVVFSFFDLFGQLGGVFELMCISMGLLVGLFSKNVLLFSMFKRLYHTQTQNIQNDNDQDFGDRQVSANNRDITTGQTHNNLFTSLRNEEQKVIPNINSPNVLVGRNLMMREFRHFMVSDNPSSSKKIDDESCAFDGVEQTSGVGMNLQDNHASNDDPRSQLQKYEHIRDLK